MLGSDAFRSATNSDESEDGLSVLIIDDNPAFLRIAARFAREFGGAGKVHALGDWRQAETAMTACKPDVVLIDLSLPGRAGLETIRRLRQTNRRVRLIALSPEKSDAYRNAALAAGATECLAKEDMVMDLTGAFRRLVQGETAPDISPRQAKETVQHEHAHAVVRRSEQGDPPE